MKIFLCKQKWSFCQGAILFYEQFIHLTQINLRPNKQFLSTQQHAFHSFLSYFLVLFRLQYYGILGEY